MTSSCSSRQIVRYGILCFCLLVRTGLAEEPLIATGSSGANRLIAYGAIAPQALPVSESELNQPETSVTPTTTTRDHAEKGDYVDGDPNIEVSVNLPAFRLTLWQNGREVSSYPIGIAQKNFPTPVGLRKAEQVVWNPPWIPPDSQWVLDSKRGVEPGEYISPNDRRNPLGKIKIPIGKAFLIHQAASSADIGSLVSHGCIRMQKQDLRDLADKIVSARAPRTPPEKIMHADQTSETLTVNLERPLLVGVNYDTMVIEDGYLKVYPDVYGWGINTIENLRSELLSANIDTSQLDDQMLQGILKRVKKSQAFVVALQDIRDGDALEAGRNESLKAEKVSLSRR